MESFDRENIDKLAKFINNFHCQNSEPYGISLGCILISGHVVSSSSTHLLVANILLSSDMYTKHVSTKGWILS